MLPDVVLLFGANFFDDELEPSEAVLCHLRVSFLPAAFFFDSSET
jgi:hypothetical protein